MADRAATRPTPSRLEAGAPRIVLNGTPTELTGIAPTTTLLDWLREHAGLRGTKEGCAEGDCGACTVVIERRDEAGRIERTAINACLALVGQLDGLGVRTIEGLSARRDALHPLQAAFVDTAATQCGFCTPGFVMAAYASCAAGDSAAPAAIHDALAGNLCRCTGYRPIVEAVARALPLGSDPVARDDAALLAALAALARSRGVAFDAGGSRFDVPHTLAQALALRARHPDALLMAGATDLGLLVSRHRERLPHVIHLARVRELGKLARTAQGLRIGAAVTYSRLLETLCRDYPEARGYMTRLGSRQIRNLGTLGGNLGTASPIGDALPILLALDATVILRSAARGSREIAADAFFTGYRRTVLATDELIEAVRIPRRARGARFFVDKLSKRRDQDISAVCGAYHLAMDGSVVRQARLAFGGMAATPQRATHAEAALAGRPLDDAAIAAAADALAQDFQPLSDWRGSAAYRLLSARNLLRRLQLRVTQPALPIELDAL